MPLNHIKSTQFHNHLKLSTPNIKPVYTTQTVPATACLTSGNQSAVIHCSAVSGQNAQTACRIWSECPDSSQYLVRMPGQLAISGQNARTARNIWS